VATLKEIVQIAREWPGLLSEHHWTPLGWEAVFVVEREDRTYPEDCQSSSDQGR
jgi:hypothetical protein